MDGRAEAIIDSGSKSPRGKKLHRSLEKEDDRKIEWIRQQRTAKGWFGVTKKKVRSPFALNSMKLVLKSDMQL